MTPPILPLLSYTDLMQAKTTPPTQANVLSQAPLGQHSDYPSRYDPTLLYPIARQLSRGVDWPAFEGEDIWRAFEVSWLDALGKPEVAIVRFTLPASSPYLIESKSFKLYLNSFNQEHLSWETLAQRLQQDLSAAVGGPVQLERESHQQWHLENQAGKANYAIIDLDALQGVACRHFEPTPSLLRHQSNSGLQRHILQTHLFKSNCPVTSQPDWATVTIRYEGQALDPSSVLQYLVSYRQHCGFHEQCVEQIFSDLWSLGGLQGLEVYARYTRRGGLDINPRRYSPGFGDSNPPQQIRDIRQ